MALGIYQSIDIFLRFAFPKHKPRDQRPGPGYRSHAPECGLASQFLRYEAAYRCADRRADGGDQAHRAAREIEPAGTRRQIARNHDGQHCQRSPADPVEELNEDLGNRAGNEGEEDSPDYLGAETGKQQWLASPEFRKIGDPGCQKCGHDFRRHDQARHDQGTFRTPSPSDPFACEHEQRSVGQLKQGQAAREPKDLGIPEDR